MNGSSLKEKSPGQKEAQDEMIGCRTNQQTLVWRKLVSTTADATIMVDYEVQADGSQKRLGFTVRYHTQTTPEACVGGLRCQRKRTIQRRIVHKNSKPRSGDASALLEVPACPLGDVHQCRPPFSFQRWQQETQTVLSCARVHRVVKYLTPEQLACQGKASSRVLSQLVLLLPFNRLGLADNSPPSTTTRR